MNFITFLVKLQADYVLQTSRCQIFALTLIMIMALTLAACDNNNRSTTNSDKTTSSDESNNQTQLDTH